MNRSLIVRIAVPLILVAAAYLTLVHWVPENVVARRQSAFVGAIDGADFGTYSGLMGEGYSDRWGFTQTTATQGLRDIARQFAVLEAGYSPTGLVADGDGWIATGHLKLGGQGNAVAQQVITRANRVEEPFSFHWKKESWLPWDWKLVRIDHPNLAVPSDYSTGAGLFDVY